MLQHYSQKHSEKDRTKQESILTGYQPPAYQWYVLHVQEARWKGPSTGTVREGVSVEWPKLYNFVHVGGGGAGGGGSCTVMSSVSWSFKHYSEKCSEENRMKQENILIGYQSPACKSYTFHLQGRGLKPSGQRSL